MGRGWLEADPVMATVEDWRKTRFRSRHEEERWNAWWLFGGWG